MWNTALFHPVSFVFAALICGAASISSAQSEEGPAIALSLFVSPMDGARGIVLERFGAETSMVLGVSERMTVPIPRDRFSTESQNLIAQWEEVDASIPLFLLDQFAGRGITVYFERTAFDMDQAAKASKLCGKTPTDTSRVAFRQLFSCREWFANLDPKEAYGQVYNDALWGWFRGNYYLFTKVKLIDGLQFGPFGMQDELVAQIKSLLEQVDAGLLKADDLKPISVPQFRAALSEIERNDLKLFGAMGDLIAEGNYEDARLLNIRVFAAYNHAVPRDRDDVVDGIRRSMLVEASQRIADGLMAAIARGKGSVN